MYRRPPPPTQNQIVRKAYKLGYRVTVDGRLIDPKGKQLPIHLEGKQEYPQLNAYFDWYGVKLLRPCPVHKLAAFCIFGDEMFEPGQVVRHLDDNPLNVRHDNIALGTQSDNERDKPLDVRTAAARTARHAQLERARQARPG